MLADRWGVSDAETRRPYRCDAFVDAAPALSLWRGVTVTAPPERIWPWLLQIRVAPYSYDLIDNLGRRSPQRRLELADPAVGDPFVAAFGRTWGEVLAVETGVSLTGVLLATYMTYELVPADASGPSASTRLLLKLTSPRGGRLAPLLAVGDLVMARRQLLNLKGLAER